MGRAEKIIAVCACAVLIAVCVLSYLYRYNKPGSSERTRAADVAIASRVDTLNASRTAEASRIANEDFYQKLTEGRTINVLVVGDEIGHSSGSSEQNGWIDQLTEKLHTTYKSTFNVQYTDHVAFNAVQGWIEYGNKIAEDKKIGQGAYDCVFVCLGFHDNTDLQLRDFHVFYEDLLIRIMHDNPKAAVFPILESIMSGENGCTVDMRELAAYYELDLIDTPKSFKQSGKDLSTLTKDGQPNDAGYTLYANAIDQIIAGNIQAKKAVAYPKKKPYFTDTSPIANYRFVSSGATATGFQQQDSGYKSSKAGDKLSFAISGSILYLYYDASTGGSFQLNVDGQFYGNISAAGGSSTQVYMISDLLPAGNHTVEVITKKTPVNIWGVVGS